MFKIILYTSDKKKQAKEILYLVDKKHYIFHMFYKKSMIKIDNKRLKNLRIAENDLSKVIAVDVKDEDFIQKENCILLPPYEQTNSQDDQLKTLVDYFQSHVNLEDETFDLRRLVKEYSTKNSNQK